MLHPNSEDEMLLRILYWGAAGSGKTASLHGLHERLNAAHCGELRSVPTRLDPTITYEQFSIQLEGVSERNSRILLVAVPGAAEESQTRKQLLDRTDAIVLVCDAQKESREANLEALEELKKSLAAYGRSLSELPVVVQYNKRDLTDPFEIESLHRALNLPEAAVFETVATEGRGLLQALTAISKRTVRALRSPLPEQLRDEVGADLPSSVPGTRPNPPAEQLPLPADSTPNSVMALMEAAILADGDDPGGEELDTLLSQTRSSLDESWLQAMQDTESSPTVPLSEDLKIISVGTAQASGERAVRIPIVLGSDAGKSVSLSLTILLEPMLDEAE